MKKRIAVASMTAIAAMAVVPAAASAATMHDTAKPPASSQMQRHDGQRPHRSGVHNGSIGTVIAISSTSITIKDKRANTDKTYTLNSATKFTKGRVGADASAIAVGDKVHIAVTGAGSTVATSVDKNTKPMNGQPPRGDRGHKPNKTDQ